MRKLGVSACCLAIATLATTVRAQTFSMGECTGKPGVAWERQVDACSAVLNSGQGSAVERALAFDNRGHAYFRLGDDDKALADYSEALRLDPKLKKAYIARAYDYIDLNDPDSAIADFDAAIRIDPKSVDAFAGRTVAHSAKGEFDKAVADASEAVRLDPKSASALVSRGDAYRFKGEWDRAIADYSQSLSLDSSAKNVEALNNRGQAYADMSDATHALADYANAIQLDPMNPDPVFNRGRLYLFTGATNMAISDLTKAADLEPRFPYVALWLDIADARAKQPSTLKARSAKFDMKHWPAPIVRLFLGEDTPAQALAAATDPNAAKQSGEVCEANFYSGEWALRRGDREAAKPLFDVAARDCPTTFIERQGSLSELKALGGGVK